MAMASTSSTMKLLHETLMILAKNLKPMLPLTFFSLLSSSILYLSNYLSITPILFNISINLHVFHTDNTNIDIEHSLFISSIKKSIKQFLILESIFLLISFIIFSSINTFTLHSSSLIYLGKQPTIQDLLARVKKSSKKTITTQFFVSMLNFSFMLLLIFIVGLCFLISINGSFFLLVFGVALAMFSIYLYVHLLLPWSMIVVISTLEEGYRGISAVSRATEMIKERKKEGLVISMVHAMSTIAYYGAYTFSTVYVPQITPSPLANGLIFVNGSSILSMMVLFGYTVFYYECKMGHGDQEGMELKG
ncbi:hypothetical protein J5N97_026814 [Dioscorea zingiberensis]|uniref:Uncharacterized protein n=1 Tax=Dioscorea zingiberensis TaxID=325984 RepID=A0A9D5C316_9LILI|nr:hypothetical protein J5N97_026814 [Dioscorea zingiberensis]